MIDKPFKQSLPLIDLAGLLKTAILPHYRLVFLLIASSLLIACSTSNAFIVVNDSTAAITLEYQFSPLPPNKDGVITGTFVKKPMVKKKKDLFNWDKQWQPVAQDRATFDEQRGLVVVGLEPDEALMIVQVYNYHSHDQGNAKVHLESIKITGQTGTISYQGEQARRQFVKTDDLYILTYR
ncbi:MAG: hypothetical protein AB1489_07245 [Acidobacteriota bacterium]